MRMSSIGGRPFAQAPASQPTPETDPPLVLGFFWWAGSRPACRPATCPPPVCKRARRARFPGVTFTVTRSANRPPPPVLRVFDPLRPHPDLPLHELVGARADRVQLM